MAVPQGWWRYKLARELVEAERSALRALAGPIYLRHAREVVAHENVAWLTERVLVAGGIPVKHFTGPTKIDPLTLLPTMPDLREWVPAFMTPYQMTMMLQYGARDGVFGVLPTGAGKTLCGIVYGLMHGGFTVFVTRASARLTIAKDVVRYTTARPLILVTELPPVRLRDPNVDYGAEVLPTTRIAIVGWESLLNFLPTILKSFPTTVVFDESHVASSHKRREAVVARNEDVQEALRDERGQVMIQYRKLQNRFAAAEDLSRAAAFRLALTATPIRDRVRNLWGQVDLIVPRGFGGFYDFARRYADAHDSPWGGIDTNGRSSPELIRELVDRLSYFTYYVPHSVTHRDLPPKRRDVVYIPTEELLTGDDVLRELSQHTYASSTGETWAKLALAAAMKRPRVIEEAVAGAFPSPDGKGGGKVVIFTGLRADCEKIAAGVEKATRTRRAAGQGSVEEPKVKVWFAHGGHTTAERDFTREAYMAHPGPCVLVATGDSMGESQNLHDTDLAIDAMLPWTPGQVRQREGRFARLGMKRPVRILYLIAEGTKDEEVALAQLRKLPAVEMVAKDEVLSEFATDLRGDEAQIEAGLLAKLLRPADDEEESDEEERDSEDEV